MTLFKKLPFFSSFYCLRGIVEWLSAWIFDKPKGAALPLNREVTGEGTLAKVSVPPCDMTGRISDWKDYFNCFYV